MTASGRGLGPLGGVVDAARAAVGDRRASPPFVRPATAPAERFAYPGVYPAQHTQAQVLAMQPQPAELRLGMPPPPPPAPAPRIDTRFDAPDGPWSSYELLPPGLGLELFSPRRERPGARAMSLPALPTLPTLSAEMTQSPQAQQVLGLSPLMPSPSAMSEEPFFAGDR